MFHHTSFTLNHQIERAVYEFYDKPALVHYMGYHRRSFTYGELKKLSHQMAVFLESLGLTKGDKVALWASNSPEWVTLMLGCSLMGLVLVPIDSLASESFAQTIFTKSKSCVLFHDRTEISWASRQEKILNIFERLPSQPQCLQNYVVAGSDVLQIVYTSGTTSEPKGVILSHQNILANAYSLRERFEYPEGSCFLSLLPLSHMMEQVIGCYGPLLYGCKIVYVTLRPLPHTLAISRREGVTHMVAVPGVLELLKNRIEKRIEALELWKKYLFEAIRKSPWLASFLLKPLRGRLKMVVCGGAALKKQTQAYFQSLGIDILCGYGMTEASPVITCQSPYQQTPGQVGKVLPRQFLRIHDDGEILTFGDNITRGYFENEAATQASFTCDGWLRTGDRGVLDSKGNLILLGRSKEMILTDNGMNIFPQDIEAVLEQLSPGSVAVVFEDPRHLGRLMAALKAKEPVDLEKLLLEANQKLGQHQKLNTIHLWPGDFPRTHTMKIQRNKVKEHFIHLKPTQNEIQIPKAIGIIFQMAGKTPTANWHHLYLKTDLGFDSLAIVQLWMKLQSELGYEISSQMLEENLTLEHLLLNIEAKRAQPKKKKVYLGENCHGWKWACLRRFTQPLLHFFLKTYFKTQLENPFPQELLKLERPVMIIANHTSHLDLMALFQALPKTWRTRLTVAAARDYFFEKRHALLGRLVNAGIGCIGFSREGDHESNMALLESHWKNHHPLILMPEGTRSRTGKRLPIKKGAAWIAMQFQAVILPVHLEGCFERWPASASFPKRTGPLSASFQPVIDTKAFNDVESLTQAMDQALS
jgi:long-chain acyl-CoA synthetase